MKDKYYTATEAARVLGLEYHTFMARVRNGRYTFEWWGKSKVFEKQSIDNSKRDGNASHTFTLA
jgi:hypothetical protein